jgi:hypothetical protein
MTVTPKARFGVPVGGWLRQSNFNRTADSGGMGDKVPNINNRQLFCTWIVATRCKDVEARIWDSERSERRVRSADLSKKHRAKAYVRLISRSLSSN